MSCIPCFSSQGKKASKKVNKGQRGLKIVSPSSSISFRSELEKQKQHIAQQGNKQDISDGTNNIEAQTFTYRELAQATKNFRTECLLGEGGFGRVYMGVLMNGQTVAVKQLDRNGLQGNKEFLVEVLMLSLLHHPNLVNLIGYCADGDQRLLVYEYMPLGSLEAHLFGPLIQPTQKPLDWNSRMKTALGAAMGLEYLHDKANPPVIYRDLKSSNILLDEDFHAKLSDFGLAKLGPTGGKTHVSTRVMGTYGYCAPEYQRTGKLTAKSDIYSYGVVLLELITGRRAIDTSLPKREQYLVAWAQPVLRDQRRYRELADPLLGGNFPAKGLKQAVAIAALCVHEEENARPMMSDVVSAFSFLVPKYGDTSPTHPEPSHARDSATHEGQRVEERKRAVTRPSESSGT